MKFAAGYQLYQGEATLKGGIELLYHNIMFHNVAELEKIEELPGLRLQRFPKDLVNKLGGNGQDRGRLVAQASTGCEIRFVTDSSKVRITLSATDNEGDIIVYCGDFFHSVHRLPQGVMKTIRLDRPERFSGVEQEALRKKRFSNEVWRIMISRGYNATGIVNVAFHHIESFGYDIKPPSKDQLPALKWLAYGSSITHGSGAILHHNSYIQHAARRLGVDVLNKGIGGACLCEPEMADYLAQEEWDFATLELGVNMRELFTDAEFEQRARYMISEMINKNPDKPIVLITIYPNSADYSLDKSSRAFQANASYREILEKIWSEFGNKNLHLIDGRDILEDFSGLTCDLIHPSDYGHIAMGENLAKKLREILDI